MDRLPCPSPAYSNSCPSSQWCDPHHIRYVFIHKHIRLNETINITFTKLLGGCIFLHIQKFFWFWCYPYYLANLLSCLVKIKKNWVICFFFLILKCLLCVYSCLSKRPSLFSFGEKVLRRLWLRTYTKSWIDLSRKMNYSYWQYMLTCLPCNGVDRWMNVNFHFKVY